MSDTQEAHLSALHTAVAERTTIRASVETLLRGLIARIGSTTRAAMGMGASDAQLAPFVQAQGTLDRNAGEIVDRLVVPTPTGSVLERVEGFVAAVADRLGEAHDTALTQHAADDEARPAGSLLPKQDTTQVEAALTPLATLRDALVQRAGDFAAAVMANIPLGAPLDDPTAEVAGPAPTPEPAPVPVVEAEQTPPVQLPDPVAASAAPEEPAAPEEAPVETPAVSDPDLIKAAAEPAAPLADGVNVEKAADDPTPAPGAAA